MSRLVVEAHRKDGNPYPPVTVRNLLCRVFIAIYSNQDTSLDADALLEEIDLNDLLCD